MKVGNLHGVASSLLRRASNCIGHTQQQFFNVVKPRDRDMERERGRYEHVDHCMKIISVQQKKKQKNNTKNTLPNMYLIRRHGGVLDAARGQLSEGQTWQEKDQEEGGEGGQHGVKIRDRF